MSNDGSAFGGVGGVGDSLLGGDLGDQVLAVGVRKVDELVRVPPACGRSGNGRISTAGGRGEELLYVAENAGFPTSFRGVGGSGDGTVVLGQDSGEQDTALSQSLGQHSGIDTPHGGHALLLEPFAQARVGQVVRVRRVVVGDDQGGDVDVRRLELEGQRVEQICRGRDVVCVFRGGDVGGRSLGRARGPFGDTVVADEGVRQDEDLGRVGGIRQGFGVTDHTWGLWY